MKNNEVCEKVKRLYSRIAARLKLLSTRLLRSKPRTRQVEHRFCFKEPFSTAYQFIGHKIGTILPLFRDLDSNLHKSGLKINFKAYVSLTVFAAILTSFVVLALVPCVLIFAFNVQVLPAILFGLGGSLFSSAFSVAGFYVYPIYRADKLRRGLEDEMPFTTGYMAILTSAGVSPEKIFYSLSNLTEPLAVSAEAKNVVRDVNLFGLDIISALEEASKRTPSERFREMLEGFISTIHSGGNLTAYLREKSKQYMKLKRMSLHKFADTLSMFAEFYVALLVTGPLLLVVMLAVMAMLGGGSLVILSPDLILNMLTYLGIPLGSVMFLIVLDAVSPKW